MPTITLVTKTHTVTLETDRETSADGWWLPGGSTIYTDIYIDPLMSERAYMALPSPDYYINQQKAKKNA